MDAVRSILRKIDLDEAALHGGEALRQLEVLGADDLPALEAHYRPAVLHRRGLQVGEIRATFTLQ